MVEASKSDSRAQLVGQVAFLDQDLRGVAEVLGVDSRFARGLRNPVLLNVSELEALKERGFRMHKWTGRVGRRIKNVDGFIKRLKKVGCADWPEDW